jgi:D-threo-aldose 1-dehydrogenase
VATHGALARRPLGRSRVSVTRLGFGTAPIGNLYAPMSDADALAAVREAQALGVGYFDTAPFYGFGLAEKRLAAGLRATPDAPRPVISTKVGRLLEPTGRRPTLEPRQGYCSPEPFETRFDYGYDAVMRSHESSLARLGVERVEILLGHDLGALTHGADHERHLRDFLDGGLCALRKLRDEGAVDAIGLGVNEWQICATILEHAEVDCFLLAGRYTLLEQGALDSFLPLCARRGVSIIVGGPFNSGILVAGSRAAARSHYNYAPPPPEVVARVVKLEEVCAEFNVPLAAAALQFPLGHPQVAAVIPGGIHPREVRAAREWLDARIPDGFWKTLRERALLHPDAPTPG